jgi:hypothetical protein
MTSHTHFVLQHPFNMAAADDRKKDLYEATSVDYYFDSYSHFGSCSLFETPRFFMQH